MLRITTIHDSHGQALKLEGKLLAPWTNEVRDACTRLAAQTTQPRLDLMSLSFVDAAGIDLLRKLQSEGFELAACSSFVTAVLRPENS
jgi:anti-anti-sigma regulatory factor